MMRAAPAVLTIDLGASDEEEEGDNGVGRGDAVDVRSAGYVGRYHRERGDSSSSDGEYSHAEVIDRTPSFLSRA